MKHWDLDIFGYWVIGAGCQIKKDLEYIAPVLQIVQKVTENYCSCLYLSTAKFGDFMNCGSEDEFKIVPWLMCRYSSWCHRFDKSWDG